MPLLDHFHPPLSVRRPWESFHTTWAAALADHLNRELPENVVFCCWPDDVVHGRFFRLWCFLARFVASALRSLQNSRPRGMSFPAAARPSSREKLLSSCGPTRISRLLPQTARVVPRFTSKRVGTVRIPPGSESPESSRRHETNASWSSRARSRDPAALKIQKAKRSETRSPAGALRHAGDGG